MSETIPIQRATPQDMHEVMNSLQQQAFNLDTRQALETLTSFFERDIYFVYIAITTHGALAGCITMEESHALYAGGAFGTLREFYVRPEFRSRNIGQQLLGAAKVFGQSHGWTRLEVTTPPLPQFDRTLAFYERHDFSITGGRKLKAAL